LYGNARQRTLRNCSSAFTSSSITRERLAHAELDRAVLAAYAAVDPEGDWSEDWAEVWEETGAGQPLPDRHALAERRAETDGLVLTNLLRLNKSRSG